MIRSKEQPELEVKTQIKFKKRKLLVKEEDCNEIVLLKEVDLLQRVDLEKAVTALKAL